MLTLPILLGACIVPKEARMLKKNTKEWRQSPVVLEAWVDSPLSSTFLTLRKNGKFEHFSTGLLRSFNAGEWTHTGDSIGLTYVDREHNVIEMDLVLIDRSTSTLAFPGDSMAFQRLQITTNKIE